MTILRESIEGAFLEARKEGKEWDVVLLAAGKSRNNVIYPAEVLRKAKHLFEGAKAFAYEFRGKVFDHLPAAAKKHPAGFVKNLVGWFRNVRFGDFVDVEGRKRQGLLARFHVSEGAEWLRKTLRDAWQHGKKNLLGFSIDAQGTTSKIFEAGEPVVRAESIDHVDSVDVVTFPAAGGQLLRLVASGGFTMNEILEAIRTHYPHWLDGFAHENLEESEIASLVTNVLEANCQKARDQVATLAESGDMDALEKALHELRLLEQALAHLQEGAPEKVKALFGAKGDETQASAETEETSRSSEAAQLKRGAATIQTVLNLLTQKRVDDAIQLLKNWLAVYPRPYRVAPERGFYSLPYGKPGYPPVLRPYYGFKGADLDPELRIKMIESRLLLKEKLAESDLPQRAKDRISEFFKDAIFEESHIADKIAEEKAYLAELSESGQVTGCGATRLETGEDRIDKIRKALDGFFAGEDVGGVPRFKTIREAFAAFSGQHDPDAQTILRESANYRPRSERLSESLTTVDWAEVLGDSITRRMIAEYKLPGLDDWRKIVSDIVPVKDFRVQRRMRIGGYGILPTVAEQSDYMNLASPPDEEATYAISKRGGIEDWTLEMIANDDVGALRRLPQKLGRAAAMTIYQDVFSLLSENMIIYDGTNLFTAAHNNVTTAALSSAELDAARKRMMQQTAYGTPGPGSELGMSNIGRWLIVPPDLESLAFRLTTSKTLIGATGQAATEPNIHSTYGLGYIVVPFWADTNNWYLAANGANVPLIEVGFWQGREEPELFVQEAQNLGNVWAADRISYKIRFIYGLAVLDYRGFYAGIVL